MRIKQRPGTGTPGALNSLEQIQQVFHYRQSGLYAFKHSIDHCYNIKQQSPQEGKSCGLFYAFYGLCLMVIVVVVIVVVVVVMVIVMVIIFMILMRMAVVMRVVVVMQGYVHHKHHQYAQKDADNRQIWPCGLIFSAFGDKLVYCDPNHRACGKCHGIRQDVIDV